MNFLAHLYLARPTEFSLIGNLLGDFVKGRPETLHDTFPAEIIEGIRQHRAIDRFTDSHRIFSEARALLSPERRRFAGIIVDVFYDHFLSINWPKSDQALDEFINHSYTTLRENTTYLVEPLTSALPRMEKENWLGAYRSYEGLKVTFERIVRRSPRLTQIAGAEQDLFENFEAYEVLYQKFFPELITFSDNWKANKLLPKESF